MAMRLYNYQANSGGKILPFGTQKRARVLTRYHQSAICSHHNLHKLSKLMMLDELAISLLVGAFCPLGGGGGGGSGVCAAAAAATDDDDDDDDLATAAASAAATSTATATTSALACRESSPPPIFLALSNHNTRLQCPVPVARP